MRIQLLQAFAISSLLLGACNNQTATAPAETAREFKLKDEQVSYASGTLTMNSYVAYDENREGKRPVVLVIPEWWGLNEYARKRARDLAELGYLAIAVDMYGNGKTVDNPDSAGANAGPFYQNPVMGKERIEAAIAKISSYAQADTGQMAAIGYCFGGAQVLNAARLGEPFKGVVSFHGSLVGVTPDKNLVKAQVLVCHGEADPFVPVEEVAKFKQQMDSAGVAYTFKGYPGATHAFTNPDATEMGKKFSLPIAYNPAADTASWNDMKVFFGTIFK